MIEDEISFEVAKVFYNPEMRFCRSAFSLAIGAIGGQVKVLDAFCASGIRGIRYAKENKNVSGMVFLDWSENSIKLARRNARANKLKNAKFVNSDVNRFLVENFYSKKFEFDVIELDPFGTPSPHLYPAFFSMQRKKTVYISASATDTAVLCGPETAACMKNYHSKSLNNEFTHENGLRILVKRIAEVAAEFNFGIEPLFSISDRHYLKVFVKCENNAAKAEESMKKLGFVSYCSCGWRNARRRMIGKCERCGKETDYGGPLWLGETSNRKFVEKMISLNSRRDYEDGAEISKKLELIKNEVGMPPWYFNIHKTCKRTRMNYAPGTERILERLKRAGFSAVRTHFSDVSIKTDAGVEEVEKAIKTARG